MSAFERSTATTTLLRPYGARPFDAERALRAAREDERFREHLLRLRAAASASTTLEEVAPPQAGIVE